MTDKIDVTAHVRGLIDGSRVDRLKSKLNRFFDLERIVRHVRLKAERRPWPITGTCGTKPSRPGRLGRAALRGPLHGRPAELDPPQQQEVAR